MCHKAESMGHPVKIQLTKNVDYFSETSSLAITRNRCGLCRLYYESIFLGDFLYEDCIGYIMKRYPTKYYIIIFFFLIILSTFFFYFVF